MNTLKLGHKKQYEKNLLYFFLLLSILQCVDFKILERISQN